MNFTVEQEQESDGRWYKHFYSGYGMGQWPSIKARRLLAVLSCLGWKVKRII